MADFPVYEGAIFESIGTSTGDSGGTSLTSGSSANTKGSWVPLSSSAPEGINSFFVQLHNPDSTSAHGRSYVDIGIGAEGSEVVLIPDLMQHTRVQTGGYRYPIPMAIPGGVRVAARLQAGTGALKTLDVSMGVFRGGALASPPLNLATHYGLVTATTTGTEIDPGATANTKCAPVVITASCNQIRSLLIIIGEGTTAESTYTRSRSDFLLDIGVGSSGAETYILQNIPFVSRTVDDLLHPGVMGPFDCYIPSGTRIVARAQSNNSTTGERQFCLSILGFN